MRHQQRCDDRQTMKSRSTESRLALGRIAAESSLFARGQVVLVDVEVIIADPPLALIQALGRQIRDAGLQHELTCALPGCIVHSSP